MKLNGYQIVSEAISSRFQKLVMIKIPLVKKLDKLLLQQKNSDQLHISHLPHRSALTSQAQEEFYSLRDKIRVIKNQLKHIHKEMGQEIKNPTKSTLSPIIKKSSPISNFHGFNDNPDDIKI